MSPRTSGSSHRSGDLAADTVRDLVPIAESKPWLEKNTGVPDLFNRFEGMIIKSFLEKMITFILGSPLSPGGPYMYGSITDPSVLMPENKLLEQREAVRHRWDKTRFVLSLGKTNGRWQQTH